MTNMQHYMDDIHDLLEGLSGEMNKRLEKICEWDAQIADYSEEIRRVEQFVFDTSKSKEARAERLFHLANLKTKLRNLAERKCALTERNQNTVEAVYSRLNELAYHCKLEVEIDNPGCTEIRERLFRQSAIFEQLEANRSENATHSIIPSNSRRTRGMSSMTDDDKLSTRSGTPFQGKDKLKKRVGRPRNNKDYKESFLSATGSAVSSARSSVERERERGRERDAEKKMAKSLKKKQEKAKKEKEQREKFTTLNAKRELENGGGFDSFSLNGWLGDDSGKDELEPDDERELLDCLMHDFEGLQSPPKGMMEALDVTESGLYSMEMYPPNHTLELKSSDDLTGGVTGDNTNTDFLPPFSRSSSTSNYSSSLKRTNAATSSSSSELVEKRKRNMLFGSIADKSFCGRPRKLTDRVTEMLISHREKEERQKIKRESEEWCICDGLNTGSEMMVECENKNCRIEWFHFNCVGLSAAPQDEWFCPECRHLPEKQIISRL